MCDSVLERVNELARKSKTVGLTEEEIKERDILRKKYIENFRRNFKNDILENTYIVDENGNKMKLKKKHK